jgi:HK97 family phage portal protein
MALKLFSKARKQAAPVPPKATAQALPIAGLGGAVWGARDTCGLARAGFIENPIGFRAVKLIAEAVASVLMLSNDAGHGGLMVLMRPNADQAQGALIESLVMQLLLTGNGYLKAGLNDIGQITALHVLRSDRVRVVPDADGWPQAFDYTVGARKLRFAVGQGASPICHIKFTHPQDDHYGLAPLNAAAKALDVHAAASAWSKALLDNAARPSGALVYRGPDGSGSMGADQYDRLVSEIETYHQGARNAGRPLLLEGGLDWKPMGFSPSDMEFEKTKETAAREIAIAFGVPPMLLGIPGEATYANYQEANRAFYRLTVLPMAERIGAALGDWLSDHFDAPLVLRPDLNQISALAPEREALWRRISEADFLAPAEKRRLLGLPAQPQEDQNG